MPPYMATLCGRSNQRSPQLAAKRVAFPTRSALLLLLVDEQERSPRQHSTAIPAWADAIRWATVYAPLPKLS